MITEIRILNRFAVQNILLTGGSHFPYENRRWNIISINDDPNDELITSENFPILKDIGCDSYCSLCFADITDVDYIQIKNEYLKNNKSMRDIILFNDHMAEDIVDFIKRIHAEEEDSVLIVHCHAGISRSGAVGTFACDFCRLDYQKFCRLNPYIMPNSYVLRLLKIKADMVPSFEHDSNWLEDESGLLIPSKRT